MSQETSTHVWGTFESWQGTVALGFSCLIFLSCVFLLDSTRLPYPLQPKSTILTAHRFPLLHAALLSGQHFNKQSPGNRMLLNGCVLLAGSEQAVYGGACQLLPLGCCSMWKQWRESAFDASPTWFSHSVSLFSLWWEFCEVFLSNRRADLSTPTREEEEQEAEGKANTHGAAASLHISLHIHPMWPFFFVVFLGKFLGIVKMLAFYTGFSDFIAHKIVLEKKVE